MSDQGKWFKLWCSVLNDAHLDALDVAQFGRWCKVGTVMKEQGTNGVLELIPPARTLQAQLQVTSWQDLLGCVKRLPGYALEMRNKVTNEEIKSVTPNVTVESVTYKIICANWNKYQGDFSGDRVKRFRQRVTPNVTAQEEKRREEKRREETLGNGDRVLGAPARAKPRHYPTVAELEAAGLL